MKRPNDEDRRIAGRIAKLLESREPLSIPHEIAEILCGEREKRSPLLEAAADFQAACAVARDFIDEGEMKAAERVIDVAFGAVTAVIKKAELAVESFDFESSRAARDRLTRAALDFVQTSVENFDISLDMAKKKEAGFVGTVASLMLPDEIDASIVEQDSIDTLRGLIVEARQLRNVALDASAPAGGSDS